MKKTDRHIDIMGIVNLTDDSYFAESRCMDDPMKRIEDLLSEGATIIDLGACSTRPGAVPVGVEEEWRRLKPVIERITYEHPDMTISIDTVYSEIIGNAYRTVESVLGADRASKIIVNDISAGEDDKRMLPLVGELGLRYIVMHKRGTSLDMQEYCRYDDVLSEVRRYFEDFAVKASQNGISDWILDPGFGFAKNIEQNYALLNGLESLCACGSPVLVGVSRKSMIYKFLDISPEDALPATQVLHLKALQNGADILRVHDVAEAVRTVRLYRVLR